MEFLWWSIGLVLVGVFFASVSIWMHPRVMDSESFIGEFFGGILWGFLTAAGATGIVVGCVMILAWTDGVRTLQQFI